MSTKTWRHRSSTAASAPPENTKAFLELRLLLDTVCATLRTASETTYPDLPTLLEQCQSIRRYLIASPLGVDVNDDFRRLDGFYILLQTLRTFSGFYHPSKRSQKDKTQLFELLDIILALLAQTFREHHGNRRFFKKRVDGGGWAALEQAIASIGIGGSESDVWGESQLLGRLLSFSLDDKRVEILCQKAVEKGRIFSQAGTQGTGNASTESRDTLPTIEDSKQSKTHDEEVVLFVAGKLDDMLRDGTLLHNPDVIPILIDFWKTIPRSPKTPVNPCALVVVLTLKKICAISNYNLLAFHSTGILSTLLPLALDVETPLGPVERQSVEELCASLICLGINSLNDSQYLIRNKSPAAADFLLRALKSSHAPACIEFDLSINGYSSVELATLGRPFPPPSSQPGYTFTAWIYINQFDPNSHTTIFGAFDTTQTCFVLAYLERDTKNFILQTSVTNQRPSVRFKQVVFEERKWYHIAIVHRRPRAISSSKAALYVNGEFSEQVKCQYPSQPPPANPSVESLASFTTSVISKTNPVQAFLGTPQDLSSRLGRGVVFTRWSLASAHLFEDVLSDDLVAVYFHLGPRYNGNFQDCLGSFQTYEASAALGMRNEQMHPGKDESSEILSAIREKASNIVPESRIVLSILPSSVLGKDGGKTSDTGLIRGLARTAANNLYELTHSSNSLLALNSAVPSVNEALVRAQGATVMTGEPVVMIPQSLDESLWRLGGFAGIVLKLVENATTKESIVRAVETLFESIKGSWRNSEAMERENGYAILGAILRGKIGAGVVVSSKNGSSEPYSMTPEDKDQLGFQLLSLVLEFVGYNHQTPEDSFIINPLAYRILLVDFDLWRKTASITQKLYYKQFITFGVNSKFHQFNSRRLFRMRKCFSSRVLRFGPSY